MTPPFCNVALPVPLRTTFTYAIPEALQGTVQAGSRVLVLSARNPWSASLLKCGERSARDEYP